MKKVEFKFDLEEKVKTPFDEEGFIYLCALGATGNIYYVKTPLHVRWLEETKLTKI